MTLVHSNRETGYKIGSFGRKLAYLIVQNRNFSFSKLRRDLGVSAGHNGHSDAGSLGWTRPCLACHCPPAQVQLHASLSPLLRQISASCQIFYIPPKTLLIRAGSTSYINQKSFDSYFDPRTVNVPMSPKLLRRAVRGLNMFLSGGTNTIPDPVYGRHERGNTDRVGNRASIDHEPDVIDPTKETIVKVITYDRKNPAVSEKRD